MNLKVANLNTQTGDRFIMKSGDPGVAVFNTVDVGSYASDLPSKDRYRPTSRAASGKAAG